MKHWLPDMDLNHDKQIQSLLCYRYTIGQAGAPAKLGGFVNQSSRRCLSGSVGVQKGNRAILLLFCLLWLFPVLGQAQFYPPIIADASITKFLDENAAFSGMVEMTLQPSGGSGDKIPVRFATLNGATRVEMDVTQFEHGDKSRGNNSVWRDYLKDMKTAGSSESIAIFNPAKRSVFIILPKLKVYLRSPIPDKALGELKRRPKPEKTELAKETLDGHSCTKFRLSFDRNTRDAWRTWETPSAILWAASDLKGQPLRIEVIDSLGETNSTMVFKKLDLRKPDAGLFDALAGFIECSDEQELMGHIMKKWPKKE